MSDDRKVTVCAACLTAFCWLRPRSKNACAKRADGLSVQKTVAELREIATGEHKSWWKEGAGESEDPRDEEDVRELVEWYVKTPPKEGEPARDPRMFASYLLSQAGARPAPLKKLLSDIYPAAALFIELPALERVREEVERFASRTRLVATLEGHVKAETLTEVEARFIQEEWDANNFPAQLPDSLRKRALVRAAAARELFPPTRTRVSG